MRVRHRRGGHPLGGDAGSVAGVPALGSLHNLVASFHNYQYNRFCNDETCYDTVLAKVAAAVPLYAGEVGPDTVDEKCTAELRGPHRLLEANPGLVGCPRRELHTVVMERLGDCYSLVSSYSGSPTRIWGREVQARLARNAK